MRAVPVAAALLLAACGPSDLVGMDLIGDLRVDRPRDSVLAMLGTDALVPNQPPDSLRLIPSFRRQPFYSSGTRSQHSLVPWDAGLGKQPIARDTDTPLLLTAGTVVAALYATSPASA